LSLQNVVVAVVAPHQIGAADVDIDILGHCRAEELAPIVLPVDDQLTRYDSVFEDVLFVVDVVQEQVERLDALDKAALDSLPFLERDDARDEVDGGTSFRGPGRRGRR